MANDKLVLRGIHGRGVEHAIKHMEEDGWGIVDFLINPYSGCAIWSNPGSNTDRIQYGGRLVAVNLASFGGRTSGFQSFFGDIYGHQEAQYRVPYMTYFDAENIPGEKRHLIKNGPGFRESPQINMEKQIYVPGYFNAHIIGDSQDILQEFISQGWVIKDYSELLPDVKTTERAKEIKRNSTLSQEEIKKLWQNYVVFGEELDLRKNSNIDLILPNLKTFYGVYAHDL